MNVADQVDGPVVVIAKNILAKLDHDKWIRNDDRDLIGGKGERATEGILKAKQLICPSDPNSKSISRWKMPRLYLIIQ